MKTVSRSRAAAVGANCFFCPGGAAGRRNEQCEHRYERQYHDTELFHDRILSRRCIQRISYKEKPGMRSVSFIRAPLKLTVDKISGIVADTVFAEKQNNEDKKDDQRIIELIRAG